ncbi:YajG family lipoprotein [Thalassotalea sp. PLHSN55]|uniref:YajG family lipoprotein n=1 Tax=Thalassotalea sp. PLHSN55 TaxID=3435888 RepID=UPI003F834187
MKKTKSLAILLSALLLGACASQPNHVIISPVVHMQGQGHYQHKQAAINVTDLRTSNHVVQILKEGKAAELFSSQAQLQSIVQQSLVDAFKQQGLTVNDNSNNKINVYIEQVKTSVNQGFTKYNAQNDIVLKVKIENTEQTLTKTFSSKGKSNGPLTPDMAVLERDLNQQLGGLITKLVQSNELRDFIK